MERKTQIEIEERKVKTELKKAKCNRCNWDGLTTYYCPQCGEKAIICEERIEEYTRFSCHICRKLSSYIPVKSTISSTMDELLEIGWKGSLVEEEKFVCDECEEKEEDCL